MPLSIDKLTKRMLFGGLVKPIPAEKERLLALASSSLENLKSFLPDVNIEINDDLLPFAANVVVANVLNKNLDGVTTKEAILTANRYLYKFCDLEHDRGKIFGVVLTSGFSSFGANEPLELKDIENTDEPFNICLGGIIWRTINPSFAEFIERAADPDSKDYLAASLSWELAFEEYHLVLTHKDNDKIKDGELITDPKEIAKLEKHMEAIGDKRVAPDGRRIGRIAINEVLPVGVGFVGTPAASVRGVLCGSNKENEENMDEIKKVGETLAVNLTETAKNEIKELIEASLNKESQTQKTDVIENKTIMKITNISEITDDKLKEMKASAITDFISSELKVLNDKYVAEQAEKTSLTEKNKALASEVEQTKGEMKKIQDQLNTLLAAAAEREKQDLFNQRMAKFDTEYDLTDEDRTALASQIKDVSNEAFTKIEKDFGVLLAAKKKSAKGKGKEMPMDDKSKECKASVENPEKKIEAAVTTAIDNSTPEPNKVPNTVTTAPKTMKEKYANAFSKEKFKIKV